MKYSALLAFFLVLFFACAPEQEQPVSGAFESMNLMTQMRAYPNSDIPNEGYFQAYRLAKENLKVAGQDRALVEPWEALGPWNIAGRALCVAINPENNKTIFLGSASGGLWRSYDQGFGVSWQQVETGYPILGVSSIEFAPGDSSVMYIGTGEVYNVLEAGNGAAYRPTRGTYGMGIFKSTDGGATWAPSLDWTYQQQRGVWQVKVAPSNSNIVYAGTTHGTYKSTDAGATWNQMDETVMVMDLVVHPTNADIVYIGCGNLDSPGKGIYRTLDGGENWTKAAGDLPTSFGGKIMLDIFEPNPQILYASIGNGLTSQTGASWLCKTVDGGDNWTVVNQLDYSKWQGWFAHDVNIHPNDPETIMVIGIDIFKSVDGGVTLTQQTTGGAAPGQPPVGEPDGEPFFSHSDHHDVLYDKTNPDIIYFANDGGLYGSLDGGDTFQSLNGGLQTAQFYNGVSVSQSSTLRFIGGLQDNSTVLYVADPAWIRVIGGDGSWTAWNPIDDLNLFGSSQYLNIGRSVNGGQNFSNASPPGSNASYTAFIAPFVLAPSNPDRMYAGRGILYVSVDNGQSWQTGNNGAQLNGDPLFAMEVASQNPDVLYMATAPMNSRSAVFYSSNGGQSVSEITGNLPDRFVNDVAVDPNDEQAAYVAMGGFGSGHVFKTGNAGQNWIDISGNLPDVPTSAVVVDPEYSQHLYVGNDLGIYFSPDGGTNWEDYNEGIIEGALVMDLEIHVADRMLYVGTHGKGAYFRGLEPIDVATKDLSPDIDLVNVFPSPFADHFNVEFDLLKKELVNINLLDNQGRLIKNLMPSTELLAGGQSFNYTNLAALASGTYFVNIQLESGVVTKPLIKVR